MYVHQYFIPATSLSVKMTNILVMHIVKCNLSSSSSWDRRGRMIVGFTATCVISSYHDKVVSTNPVHSEVYSMQQYVISLTVTCGRSEVFSGYSGFLHQ